MFRGTVPLYFSLLENIENINSLTTNLLWNVRFLFQLSASLRSHPVRRTGYFTDIEFAEAIETLITPLYSEQLRRRLFESAVLSSNKPKSGLIKG